MAIRPILANGESFAAGCVYCIRCFGAATPDNAARASRLLRRSSGCLLLYNQRCSNARLSRISALRIAVQPSRNGLVCAIAHGRAAMAWDCGPLARPTGAPVPASPCGPHRVGLARAPIARSNDGQSRQGRLGEYLARAGDRISCHTVNGGQLLAGGDRLNSPFDYMSAPNSEYDGGLSLVHGVSSLGDADRAMRHAPRSMITN